MAQPGSHRKSGHSGTAVRLLIAAVGLTLMSGCSTSHTDAAAAGGPALAAPAPPPSNAVLTARAKTFELDTPYAPPPGDPLEHNTSGYAKTMCSAVFITGLDPTVAAESVGYFTGPYEERKKVSTPVVDREKKEVRIALPNGVVVVARYFGSQGCITLPRDRNEPYFNPVEVIRHLPDAKTTPWPMGDVLPGDPLPAGIDAAKVRLAIDAAFEPADAFTSAFVVTHNGRVIGERYMPGLSEATPLESWSMGKSVTATLMGLLIRQGVYALDQPAPIPEWQNPGDPRQKIRIQDLLHMSSGLRINAPEDPEFDPATYPDHLFLYTGRVDSFKYAATRPLQWPPNTVGRYRNTDPVLINYLVRLAVEKRGEEYLSFPQRQLFDKIGVRSMVIETDPYGNLLTQGYDFMSGRDWARLGNLYLQDGMWNGQRLLPEGFVTFVSTLAPAWAADGRPVYGGFFWINGDKAYPVPPEAYYMAGAGQQRVLIIPSHGLVVVRLGHYKGVGPGTEALRKALAILMDAVPPTTPRT